MGPALHIHNFTMEGSGMEAFGLIWWVIGVLVVGMVGWAAWKLTPRTITVTAIWVHPIKGCRGTSVKSATIDRLGLQNDRRMMVCPCSALVSSCQTTLLIVRRWLLVASLRPRCVLEHSLQCPG